MKDSNKPLRDHLLYLLRGGGAHLSFDEAFTNFPARLRGVKPKGWDQTGWRLLEHMRIAQRDILDFCRKSKYVELEFPTDYWPGGDAPPNKRAWNVAIKSFHADLKDIEDLAAKPSTDLFARAAHGNGQTILREILLVADHNAYHLGQVVTLRRLLGAWKEN